MKDFMGPSLLLVSHCLMEQFFMVKALAQLDKNRRIMF